MNKSKIKSLMWGSIVVVAILIIIFVSSDSGIIFGVLTALIYCSIPAFLITLAHLELNKSDIKTIEEFDANEELKQHIKQTKKNKRKKWFEKNKKLVITISSLFLLAIIGYIIYWIFFMS